MKGTLLSVQRSSTICQLPTIKTCTGPDLGEKHTSNSLSLPIGIPEDTQHFRLHRPPLSGIAHARLVLRCCRAHLGRQGVAATGRDVVVFQTQCANRWVAGSQKLAKKGISNTLLIKGKIHQKPVVTVGLYILTAQCL